MADTPNFPHLSLTFVGSFEPRFTGGRGDTAEVERIKANPGGHSAHLHSILGKLRHTDAEIRRVRRDRNQPDIPADRGFLLRVPEGVDVDQLTHALGVELVSETEEGLMLVSSADLSLERLEEVLSLFGAGGQGGSYAALILDIYEQPDDPRRIQNILSPEVHQHWPFVDDQEYVFDLGIQTATSTRSVDWPRVRKRRDETDDEFLTRKAADYAAVRAAADEAWHDSAETRVNELAPFVEHYQGKLLTGMMSRIGHETEAGMIFPDSVQVRVRMVGRGFRDVILNFAHLFEVALPADVEQPPAVSQRGDNLNFELSSPGDSIRTVCIIDSGIQEDHRWLAAAIDRETSRCFVPGKEPKDVADYVSPRGHGTRVAGAVLYPREIPRDGTVEPIAWLQNARVLDENNRLPETLLPEVYLERVVAHFDSKPRFTKIFNHSINASTPCTLQRMAAWAAKLDQLSHEWDVLFIQSAGNVQRGKGNQANPGLAAHLNAGRAHPKQLLENSSRVANPAQSLHALTVGSVAHELYSDVDWQSYAKNVMDPSAFTRGGYAPPWSVVKPEVVELGGDLIRSKAQPWMCRAHPHVAIEVINSTMHGEPPFSKDGYGTSFATPKVCHIAAHLQNLFPDASPLLYRALIVQSARWPEWAEQAGNVDEVLRLIGYGLPSVERATNNAENRVTLITPDAVELPSKSYHLYTINIPDEIRNAASDARIRVDVTMAYTALPRRTRARRTGYLETWLDWRASARGEPIEHFRARMEEQAERYYAGFAWKIHERTDRGEALETRRDNGTVQKDWAFFEAHELPNSFAIAVRAHKGWNHREGAGAARYCLAVSFEATDGDVPIYSLVESTVQVQQAEIQAHTG